MLTYRSFPVFAIALAFATAAPTRAHACGVPAPGLYSSTPQDGGTLPANAALFFHGYDISLAKVKVTVDGQPASFGPAPANVPGVGDLIATITPAPKAGQTVVIQGDFCNDSGAMCAPKTLTFTAGAPDTEAPPPVDVVGYNVYDYLDFKSSGGDCLTDSDLTYWVELQTEAAKDGESQRLYTIDAFSDANFQNKVFSQSGFIRGKDTKVEIQKLASGLEGRKAQEAFCFRATSSDAAGHVTASSLVVCKACFYRADTMPNMSGPPSEPKWTTADTYPSGPCGDGASSSATSGSSGSSSGGDDVVVDGCSCQAGGSGTAVPGALAALALALQGLRRRRARR